MKRILILALLFTLTSCGNEATITTLPDPTPDQIMQASVDGLSLTLNQDTFIESPAVINTVIRNGSLYGFRYGDFYHIEVQKDEQWYMITYSNSVFLKNPRFNDSGSVLLARDEVHQSFSIEALGVTLIPGKYRLVKTFLSQGESFHEISIAVSFLVK